MYWYYKVFLATVVGLILWGVYALIDPKIDFSYFTKKDDTVESSNSESGTEKPQNSASGKAVQTPVVPRSKQLDLSPAQNNTLRQAIALFEKDQLPDDAYEKAMGILEDESLPQFSRGWRKVADFISKINSTLLTNSAPSSRKIKYIVRSGDSLDRIANKKTTVRALQKGNDIPLDSQIIHPGDVLRFFGGKS